MIIAEIAAIASKLVGNQEDKEVQNYLLLLEREVRGVALSIKFRSLQALAVWVQCAESDLSASGTGGNWKAD